jgi:hypothetical protein
VTNDPTALVLDFGLPKRHPGEEDFVDLEDSGRSAKVDLPQAPAAATLEAPRRRVAAAIDDGKVDVVKSLALGFVPDKIKISVGMDGLDDGNPSFRGSLFRVFIGTATKRPHSTVEGGWVCSHVFDVAAQEIRMIGRP